MNKWLLIKRGETIFCKCCGAEIPNDDNFCYMCGQPLKEISEAEKPEVLGFDQGALPEELHALLIKTNHSFEDKNRIEFLLKELNLESELKDYKENRAHDKINELINKPLMHGKKRPKYGEDEITSDGGSLFDQFEFIKDNLD